MLVKRFSAREERRRLVAGGVDRDKAFALDNKLNYIHQGGRGLQLGLARGLSAWLNSTPVDNYFRVFSGHAQVNAGDLGQMVSASSEALNQAVEKILEQDALEVRPPVIVSPDLSSVNYQGQIPLLILL